MRREYGLWTTGLGGGSGAGLSTFWRRRLGRLAAARAGGAGLNRRDWLKLGAAGAAALALPTLRPGPAAGLDEGEAAGALPRGRIYLEAVFEPPGGQTVRGLMSIDPETGAWSKVAEVEGSSPRIAPGGGAVAFPKYGEPVNGFVTAESTWLLEFGGDGEPRKIADKGGRISWSPDGKSMILSNMITLSDDEPNQHENWRVNVDGTGLEELPIPETDEVDDWSPDGDWLACVSDRHPPHGSGYQLYVMHPDGTGQRRLTEGQGLNVFPRFSPDGRSIVYHHQRGADSLWVVDIDGSNRRLLLAEEDLKAPQGAGWSPDGKRLAVTMHDWKRGEDGRKYIDDPRDTDERLVIMDADGKNMRRLPLPPALHLGTPEWL